MSAGSGRGRPDVEVVLNCSVLFTELPLLRRPAAVAAAGYEAVEFWWPFESSTPSAADVSDFVDAVGSAGLRLALLNFYAGDPELGERGLMSDPRRRNELAESVAVASSIAESLGCRAFNGGYGNWETDADAARSAEVAAENLVAACHAVASIDATVLVEPLSIGETYPLRSARDAALVCDTVAGPGGASNIGILLDVYHLTVNRDDVFAAIDSHIDRIGHVQIADAPGRHAPGTGRAPLLDYVRALHSAGYAGPLGFEYFPEPDQSTEASLMSVTTFLELL